MTAADILISLGRCSAQAGVLVLLILAAQRLFRRQLSPRWRCALWLLVAVRLLLPVSLGSAVSVFNFLPTWGRVDGLASVGRAERIAAEAPPFREETAGAPTSGGTLDQTGAGSPRLQEEATTGQTAAEAPQLREETGSAPVPELMPGRVRVRLPTGAPATAPAFFNRAKLLVAVWLAGVAVLGVGLAVSTFALARRIRRAPRLSDTRVEALLGSARQELGLTVRAPAMFECAWLTSPALYGCWRPRLLLPVGFAGRFSPEELRFVFLHELAHVRRRDLAVNWLLALLQVVHWFNPLVWFAFHRWRTDRELACDAMVLEATGPGHKDAYGRTILHILESFARGGLTPGLMGIMEDKRRLRERISFIATFTSHPRWSLLAVGLLGALGVIGLTDAQVSVPTAKPVAASTATDSAKPAVVTPSGSTGAAATTPAAVIPPGPTANASPANTAVPASIHQLGIAGFLNPTQAVPAGAEVSLALPAKARIGDEIAGSFNVRNGGAADFDVSTGGDYMGTGFPVRLKIRVTDAQGNVLPDSVPKTFNPPDIALSADSTLKPGESKSIPFPLPGYVAFPGPGVYTVEASHDLGWIVDDAHPHPVAKTQIEIVLPTPAEAAARVHELCTGEASDRLVQLERLRHPVFLPALLNEVGQGHLDACEGLEFIPGAASFEALLQLLDNTSLAVVKAAGRQVLRRMPSLTGTRPSYHAWGPESGLFIGENWTPADRAQVLAVARRLLQEKDDAAVDLASSLIELEGDETLAPPLLAAVQTALDGPWQLRAGEGADVLDAPGHLRSLLRATDALRARGWRVDPAVPGNLATTLLLCRQLADPKIPRPPDDQWKATLLVALKSDPPVLRENAVLAFPPLPLPDEFEPLLQAALADPDWAVVRAACEVAGKTRRKTFIPALIRIIITIPESFVNDSADRAAVALGARMELWNAWCELITDKDRSYRALEHLARGTLNLQMASAGGTGVQAPQRAAIRDGWRAFLDHNQVRLAAGERISLDDPSITPVMSGVNFNPRSPAIQVTQRNGPSWPATDVPAPIVASAATPDNQAGSIPPGTVAGPQVAQQNFTVPDVGLDMLYVVPGSFFMGDDGSYAEAMEFYQRQEAAKPANPGGLFAIDQMVPAKPPKVTLSKGFWLGKFLVTQAQWEHLMGNNPSKFQGPPGSRYVGSAQNPVEQVSCVDAGVFCQRLTDQERKAGRLPQGYAYMLPTNAQWEYACRAGTTGPDTFDLKEVAWYEANSDSKTHPVGLKQPNAWGFYDMHGNLQEWCFKWRDESPFQASRTLTIQASVADPEGPPIVLAYETRGGSWQSQARDCSSTFGSYAPRDARDTIGFRVALSAVRSTAAAAVPTPAIAPVPAPPLTAAQLAMLRGPLAAAVVKIVAGTGIRLVPIPAGTFLMGSQDDDNPDHWRDEKPQTRVTMAKDFFLGATAVTQRQYEALIGKNPSTFTAVGPDAPVETVSQQDAMRFCQKLTEQEHAAGRLPEGYAFTLPTEAQWEYACRAGTTGDYAGNLDALAWYSKNSGGTTHPVATKQPNAWGLYDMEGNVSQWCVDSTFAYSGGEVTDPVGPAPVSFTGDLARGGWFDAEPNSCRSASRKFYREFASSATAFTGSATGFRVALVRLPDEPFTMFPPPPLTAAQRAVLQGPIATAVSQIAASTGIKLVPIPAGTFLMGSPDDEAGRMAEEIPQTPVPKQADGRARDDPGRAGDEGPQTRVTLTKAFFLGATDVTQKQYEAVMGKNPSTFKLAGPDAPVETVSELDGMAFCRKLTDQEHAAGHLPAGYAFTLPTEAQWEYACRAGTTGPFPGDLDAVAWFRKNSGANTHPVATKQPNAWGLYDMVGNVAQWCADSTATYPGGAVTDPVGPTPNYNGRTSSGIMYLARGGSFVNLPERCRAAGRRFYRGFSGRTFGFRVALVRLPDPSVTPIPAPSLTSAPPLTAAQQAALKGKIGDFVSQFAAATGIRLVPVPAGTFLMGSPPDEKDRLPNEGPQTKVTLTQDFFLGATEVTQGQWAAVMGTNPSRFKGTDLPVENISWDDATAFCQMLTERERAAGRMLAGYIFTLPTEAQREYACRAGTTGPFAGDFDAMAWNRDNSGGTTHPVGTKRPNAWGFSDMHGNLWEWCRGWYADTLPGREVTDPIGPASGSDRVFRGGGWDYGAAGCRSAFRGHSPPDVHGGVIGFRVALAEPEETPATASVPPSAAGLTPPPPLTPASAATPAPAPPTPPPFVSQLPAYINARLATELGLLVSSHEAIYLKNARDLIDNVQEYDASGKVDDPVIRREKVRALLYILKTVEPLAVDPATVPMEDRSSLNAMPPLSGDAGNQTFISGMGPEGIKDPVLRQEYEIGLELNSLKNGRFNQLLWLWQAKGELESGIIFAEANHYAHVPGAKEELAGLCDEAGVGQDFQTALLKQLDKDARPRVLAPPPPKPISEPPRPPTPGAVSPPIVITLDDKIKISPLLSHPTAQDLNPGPDASVLAAQPEVTPGTSPILLSLSRNLSAEDVRISMSGGEALAKATINAALEDRARTGALIAQLRERIAAAKPNSWDDAVAAQKELAAIDDPRVIPLFRQGADSRDYAMKFAALMGLAKFDSLEAFESIRAGLETKPSDLDADQVTRSESLDDLAKNIRGEAVNLLSQSKFIGAWVVLVDQRHDEDSRVRFAALQVLGKLPPRWALPKLQDMTGDPNEMIRNEAKHQIDLMSPPKSP